MIEEKSLLSILRAEDEMVNRINAAVISENHFSSYEYEAEASERECCLKLAAKYHEEAEKCRQQLDAIRHELKAYLWAIQN